MTDRDFIPGTDEWHEARGTTKPKPPTASPMTPDKPFGDRIHIPLEGGGHLTVSPDSSPKLIAALHRMVELAKNSPMNKNTIPSVQENPNGFHQRYLVNKVSGEPVDDQAEYMVLRLDWGGDDHKHVSACRAAALTYAAAIKGHLPEVARDLQRRYSDIFPPETIEL